MALLLHTSKKWRIRPCYVSCARGSGFQGSKKLVYDRVKQKGVPTNLQMDDKATKYIVTAILSTRAKTRCRLRGSQKSMIRSGFGKHISGTIFAAPDIHE